MLNKPVIRSQVSQIMLTN